MKRVWKFIYKIETGIVGSLSKLQNSLSEIKPILSISLIVLTLFSIMFFQMEERRLGYEVLKITREQKQWIESKRAKSMTLAKVTRPQHVERVAQNQLALKKIRSNQVIHLSSVKEFP